MIRSKREAATVAATNGEATPRIEIVSDRRRAHDTAFRAMVVAEAGEAGARVQDVAARHGICPSLVYRWRRLAGVSAANGPSVHLFPVRIAASPEQGFSGSAASPAGSAPKPRRAGVIEIELSGGIRVSVDDGVSVAALRRVMLVLRG
jgi:transposase